MAGEKDIENMHREADFLATGADHAKTLADSFANHGVARGTHSIPVKPHPRGIADQLLGATEKAEHPLWRDPRPLIDKVQEATFSDSIGMQWVADKYALRMILRKAHCFTLDAATSGMVAQFSIAIGADIEAARHLAIPPFPTTWVQLNNRARLDMAKSMGVGLSPSALGLTAGPPVPDIGWLITTTGQDEYAASYVCVTDVGVFVAPTSFFWTTAHEPARTVDSRSKEWLDRLVFGMHETNCNIDGAWLAAAPYQVRTLTADRSQAITEHELELMSEIAGETRHIFGLLVALGAGQLGAETILTPQPKPDGPAIIIKGKPLLPLEHKILHIKLSKRTTVEKVATKALTGVKHRWHEVRGHFRTKYNPDGSVKWRIPIKPHERGDDRLGRIEKTYMVEK